MLRSSSFFVGFLAIALGIAFVSESYAQGERPAGRRGGGGGRFGGGPFGGLMELNLLSNGEVQKELGLSNDQKERVEKLAEDYGQDRREAMDKLGIDFGALRDMSDEEREKAMAKVGEAQEKLSKQYRDKVADLLKAEQSDRLKQIALQASGAPALGTEGVAKDLDLSEDQKKEIGKIMEESMASMRRGFGRGQAGGQGQNPEDFQARMEEMRKAGEERDAKLLAVLNDEQRKKFDELKGKPFDVAALRPRGFGGGRGPGGGRGGEGGGRQRPPM